MRDPLLEYLDDQFGGPLGIIGGGHEKIGGSFVRPSGHHPLVDAVGLLDGLATFRLAEDIFEKHRRDCPRVQYVFQTLPGPTDGNWSTSPTSRRETRRGTAFSRWYMSSISTMEVSSTITASASN